MTAFALPPFPSSLICAANSAVYFNARVTRIPPAQAVPQPVDNRSVLGKLEKPSIRTYEIDFGSG
jgi:hypothetical protein